VTPFQSRLLKWISSFVDLWVLLFTWVWLMGGIHWDDRIFLKYGADSRRAALIAAAFLFFVLPRSRTRSYVLRACGWVWLKLSSDRRNRRSILMMGFCWAALLGVMQAHALRFPLYDVGIFQQILWSLTNGHGFNSTISGAGNFLQDHLSLSLVLLVPLFKLVQSFPSTLAVVHPSLIFCGVLAWVHLAERMPNVSEKVRGRLAAGVTLFALGFDSLWGNLRWGFHENSIYFFAMSWALALIFTGENSSVVREGVKSRGTRALLIVLLLFISALSKEILLLDVAFISLAWATLLWKERKSVGVIGLIVFAVVLLGVFIGYEKMPHPVDKNYFGRYYSYLGYDLNGFAKTLITAPLKIVENVGAGELFKYFKLVFLPWLFLPLLLLRVKDRRRWFLAGIIPSFMSAAIATYSPLRNSGYHYVLELWPVLAVLTLIALAQWQDRLNGKIIGLWVLLAWISLDQDPWNQMREFSKEARNRNEVRLAFATIPEDQSVVADEMAGPWVANRVYVARWPNLDLMPNRCPAWLVLRQLPVESLPAVDEILARCGNTDRAKAQAWAIQDWVAYRVR